jgi:hypothetical protein
MSSARLRVGDLATIVDCWGIPAFVLSAAASQAVTQSAEVEAFFEAAIARYRSQGFASARPRIGTVERPSGTAFSVDVEWINCDEDGAEKARERLRYVLTASEDDGLAIRIVMLKSP